MSAIIQPIIHDKLENTGAPAVMAAGITKVVTGSPSFNTGVWGNAVETPAGSNGAWMHYLIPAAICNNFGKWAISCKMKLHYSVVNGNSTGAGTYPTPFALVPDPDGAPYSRNWITFYSGSSGMGLWIYDQYEETGSGINFTANQWYDIVFHVDKDGIPGAGGKTFQLIVDGTEMVGRTYTISEKATAHRLTVCTGEQRFGYEDLYGLIDNLRFYDHALSAAEIAWDRTHEGLQSAARLLKHRPIYN